MSELSVDGRLREAEEIAALVEAFRYIGLVEDADALEQTGDIDALEWGLEES